MASHKNSRELISGLQKLLTPGEVATYLGVSAQTLACWRSTKRYPLPFVKIGRKVMYRSLDVLGFIEEQMEKHGEDMSNE